MFAVLLTSPSLDWVGLAFVMAAIGALGFFPARTRKVVLVLLILGLATASYAVPYHCDPVWKYFGWC